MQDPFFALAVNGSELNLLEEDIRTPIFGLTLIEKAGNAKGKTCATNTNNCTRGNRVLWAVHNFIMWFLWVAVMATIVCTVRYFRHYWRKLIFVHIFFGLLVFFGMTAAVTLAYVRNVKTLG